MRVIDIPNVSTFLSDVVPLALGHEGLDHVFRGQQDSTWPIRSTFSRYSTVTIADHHAFAVRMLVDRFVHGMAQVGQHDPRMDSPRARLELARHYGVPSPLIDVSRSPLIALWFAFNGVRGSESQRASSVFAINTTRAAVSYHRYLRSVGRDSRIETKHRRPIIDTFRWEKPDYFADGYPIGEVKIIPRAASWNVKMQRQQGAFIYDLLNFFGSTYSGLDEMLDANDPRANEEDAAITKFVIPHSAAREIFEFLDIAGINGAMIYNDAMGVVDDVKNTFNHNPRGNNWDVSDGWRAD